MQRTDSPPLCLHDLTLLTNLTLRHSLTTSMTEAPNIQLLIERQSTAPGAPGCFTLYLPTVPGGAPSEIGE